MAFNVIGQGFAAQMTGLLLNDESPQHPAPVSVDRKD